MRALVRPVARCRQRLQSTSSVTLEMLVAGLAANPELLAQIGHRKPVGLRQRHKTNDLFHRGYGLPRHRGDMCNPSTRVNCYLSSRIVPPPPPGPLRHTNVLRRSARATSPRLASGRVDPASGTASGRAANATIVPDANDSEPNQISADFPKRACCKGVRPLFVDF